MNNLDRLSSGPGNIAFVGLVLVMKALCGDTIHKTSWPYRSLQSDLVTLPCVPNASRNLKCFDIHILN